jgi:hypothetical protein
MVGEEISRLVVASNDRIMARGIGGESPLTERWELSSPIPGQRIINTWQIYNKIWLVLALTEDGSYNIFRTINLRTYSLVHSHADRIYGLYYIDDGHAIFCAADGWWATTDTGGSWSKVASLSTLSVGALAIVQLEDNRWALVGYGLDHKIYRAEYPGGDFEEVYDASGLTGKWYPAIAGGPVGMLAGAGDKLLRSIDAGEIWAEILAVDGVIKSIVISNQSNTPVFLVTVESPSNEGDQLYWSYDLGDSLVPEMGRIGSVASVQSVTPTGTGELQTAFAVLGRRTAEGVSSYRILEA